ncbi:MAG: hypothetical protein ACP5QT_04620 [Brevinematia bacterium]
MGIIHFKKFNVGKENYFLYIGDKLLSKYVNSKFEKSVRLEAGTNYTISLVKESDEKLVFEKDIFLVENGVVDIEYEGRGNLIVERLKNPENWRGYRYFLDAAEVIPGIIISNLTAGTHHRLSVIENSGRVVYNETFYLEDGETKILHPYLTWRDTFSFKFFSVLSEYWAIGFEYNLFRYFWGGINIGFNSFYNEDKVPLYFFFLTAETGYYYFVNHSYHFKMGVGLLGQLYYSRTDTGEDYKLIPEDKKAVKNGISLFLDFELFNFFIRAGSIL